MKQDRVKVAEEDLKKMIKDQYRSILNNNASIQPTINLKVGSKVIFNKNIDMLSVFNGLEGEVVDFKIVDKQQYPIVHYVVNGREYNKVILPVLTEIQTPDKYNGKSYTIAYAKQLPLMEGFAMTIHKSQGLTIEKLFISASDVFSPSQFYVALSRAKTTKYIKMYGYDKSVIFTDTRAVKFYEELSKGKEE
jgi:ATP-dependent exoDNAse (exonuclease V) alpha subunit